MFVVMRGTRLSPGFHALYLSDCVLDQIGTGGCDDILVVVVLADVLLVFKRLRENGIEEVSLFAADLDHGFMSIGVEACVDVFHVTVLSANLTSDTATDQQRVFEFKLLAFEGSIQDFELEHWRPSLVGHFKITIP